MFKNKFIKSTFLLILGGFITKIMSMVIKIVTNRFLGIEGISLYMMILPTFLLFNTLSQMSFPLAISKLVSKNKYNNKKLLFSTVTISIIINSILMCTIFVIAPFLSNNLLHNPNTYYPLICTAFVLPFISISSILRGYYFGKEQIMPHLVSNIIEQIIRLISIFLIIPIMFKMGTIYAVIGVIICNLIGEISSLIVLLFYLPKKVTIYKTDIIPSRNNITMILETSIPATIQRLLGNITYFFEPIIFTSILIYLEYNKDYILTEYGIVNGYVLTLLFLPSFFSAAISQALLPVVSRAASINDKKTIKRKFYQACLFSLLIGIPICIIFYLFPETFLNAIYNTNEGTLYLKFLAPFFILLYIQSNITTILHAVNASKVSMKITFISSIVKLSILVILLFLHFGIYALLISIVINIIFTTIFEGIELFKYFRT